MTFYYIHIVIFLFIFYLLYQFSNSSIFNFKNKLNFKKSELKPSEKQFLTNYSFYYSQLPSIDREDFENRILIFVNKKNWHAGKDMKIITRNHQIAIASYAVQITFGLPIKTFEKFKTIVLYQDQYKSQITGKIHKGEVNVAGAIVLSWKYFEEGAKNTTDGINLGLHEMAHAFFINNFSSQSHEQNQVSKEYFDRLYFLSEPALQKINAGLITCMRSYSATNFQEFFACTVETFFEKPFELKEQLPDIYNCMSSMLCQDPTLLYKKP